MPIRDWRTSSTLAINSILQQSHQNLELLLVGQTCVQTLRDHLRAAGINDPRIRVLARQSVGIVNALNVGLAQASGDFIARMDDDDFAYVQRIAVQLQFLNENPQIQLCAACVRFVDHTGDPAGVASGNLNYAHWLNTRILPEQISHACFAENPMPHPTLLAHNAIWKQLNGYRDVDGPEDHDLILRAMLGQISMGKPEEVLLDWREHPDRLTYTDSRYRRQAFVAQSARAWVQQQPTLGKSPRRTVWIAGTGKQARHWHDELQTCGVHINGFVDMHRPGPQRQKRQLPVITYDELAAVRSNEFVVSAVTQPAARSNVQAFFTDQGWREGVDFIVGG